MADYPFYQVDAFTSAALGGNPCAIVFDADDLDDATMLAIAREMNLSETAFVRRSGVADVGVRYFTPAEEIPLAGHPTIATTFALIDSGRVRLAGELTTISLELRVGPIQVRIKAHGEQVEQITMRQLPPTFLRTYTAEEIAPLFGLLPEDVLPGAPIQTVSTGTPQLMVALRDHAALRRAQLDVAAYQRFRASADFFSPHLFCLGGATPEGRTFARHFSPPPDVLEDPFTGSATGGMACYLWRYGLIDTPDFVAEQGHWMRRPGLGFVHVEGGPDAIAWVEVGGAAVAVLRGTLSL